MAIQACTLLLITTEPTSRVCLRSYSVVGIERCWDRHSAVNAHQSITSNKGNGKAG